MRGGIEFFGAMRHGHNHGITHGYGLPENEEKRKFTILIVLNLRFNVRLGGCFGGGQAGNMGKDQVSSSRSHRGV
jgi:hypothetical protein